VISEEKTTLSDDDISPYRSNNYLTWLKRRRVTSGVPTQRFLLSDITVWVDPLDATQEFTEGLLQYVTVMLCVAVRGRPKFGVIHRPFFNETSEFRQSLFLIRTCNISNQVWGLVGHGIYPSNYDNENASLGDSSGVALVSRSHAGRVADILATAMPNVKVVPAGGSGYKTLAVLNGSAQLYVHTTRIKRFIFNYTE